MCDSEVPVHSDSETHKHSPGSKQCLVNLGHEIGDKMVPICGEGVYLVSHQGVCLDNPKQWLLCNCLDIAWACANSIICKYLETDRFVVVLATLTPFAMNHFINAKNPLKFGNSVCTDYSFHCELSILCFNFHL